MTKEDKKLNAAVKQTMKLRGSIATTDSEAWFIENLSRCLHPTLRSLADAERYTKNNDRVVHGIYFRRQILTDGEVVFKNGKELVKKKIGAGYIAHGQLTRDARTSNDTSVLQDEIFIPCVNEVARLVLERTLQYYYGSDYEIPQGIKLIIKRKHDVWIEPATNERGTAGGNEWFDFSDFSDPAQEFVNAVTELTKEKNINKSEPEYDDYQEEGSGLLAEHVMAKFMLVHGSLKDFYLLMKPRSGKNITALRGLARFVKAYKELKPDCGCLVVDFISQWPSAFSGAVNDVKGHRYADGIEIGYVDTRMADWHNSYLNLLTCCDVVLRFASMQSLNKEISKKCREDLQDSDGEIEFPEDTEEFDASKLQTFKDEPAQICIIDESDAGMRTTLSKLVLNQFSHLVLIHLSGTDLYALKSEIEENPRNYFLYDIIDERRDIESDELGLKSLKRKRSKLLSMTFGLDSSELPFNNLSPDEMDMHGISRRLRNLFKTSVVVSDDSKNKRNNKSKYNVKFVNEAEVIAFIKRIYEWVNLSGMKCPGDIDHFFWTVPSVAAARGLVKLQDDGKLRFIQHKLLLANSYRNIATIEVDVQNDQKKFGKTAFVTVGKMLRGAKAGWSGVVRMDDYRDFKVGLQIILRGQNVDTEEWCYVWDANPWRTTLLRYDIFNTRSKGDRTESQGSELYNLIPIYRNCNGFVREESWEETSRIYHESTVREGLSRDTNYDINNVHQSARFLAGVLPLKKPKQAADAAAGKIRAMKPRPGKSTEPLSKPQKDLLLDRAKSIGVQLGLLVSLNQSAKTINDLLFNTPEEDFCLWLDHIGADSRTGYWNLNRFNRRLNLIRHEILNMFDAERINEQIIRLHRRIVDDGVNSIDWTQFNRGSLGDVNTPVTAVCELLSHIPESYWKNGGSFIDPSCSDGEFPVQVAKLLQAYGHDPSTLVYYADSNPLNLRITSIRLGFDNGFCYNIPVTTKVDDLKNLKDLFMSKYKKQFDLYATNPPFQKADKSGRDDDNLWPAFLDLGKHLTKPGGYEVFVTPGSWGSLGTNNEKPGSTIRKKYFDTVQVDVVDFTIGSHFKEGSTFTGYVFKQGESVAGHKTKFIFEDGVSTREFSDYPCFPLKYSNSELIDIVKHFRASDHYGIIMEDPYHTKRAAMPGKIKSNKYSLTAGPDHPYRAYHTNAQTHVYSQYKNSFHDQWKVVFSYSGTWKAEVSNDCSLTDASMCILCDTQEEALSVQSVLQSEPIKFLIDKVFRWSGYYSGLFIRWIPALPKNKIYTNDEVYAAMFTENQANVVRQLIADEAAKKTK